MYIKTNKIMRLTELRDIVNEKFDVRIELKSRKRHTVYAKKVFCTLAKKLDKYSLEKIGDCINMSHCNTIFHINTIDKVYNLHKKGYNEIVKEYSIASDLLKVRGWVEEKHVKILPKYILDHLDEYTENDLLELYQTRLKPFKMLLDTRRKQKETKNVIGAKLLR